MAQLLKHVNPLINLSYLPRGETLRRLAIPNPIETQQYRYLSQAETGLLRALHASQLLQCRSAVVPKATSGALRLRQQAAPLVVAHGFYAHAPCFGQLADRHLEPHGIHRFPLTLYHGTDPILRLSVVEQQTSAALDVSE